MNLSKILFLSNTIFYFIEGILGLRILLKLFGAYSSSPFVAWVYTTSKPLLFPFEGMFPTVVPQNGFVIEISTLFAFLVYVFLGYVISEELTALGEKKREKKEEK